MITSGGTATLGLYDNISEIRKKADITYVDAKASDLQQNINSLAGGHVGYTTLALANAAKSTLAPNTLVEVTNDTTTSNNGLYLWNGTTLTKSQYDPLTQSKQYADNLLTTELSIATDLNTLAAGNYFLSATNLSTIVDAGDFITLGYPADTVKSGGVKLNVVRKGNFAYQTLEFPRQGRSLIRQGTAGGSFYAWVDAADFAIAKRFGTVTAGTSLNTFINAGTWGISGVIVAADSNNADLGYPAVLATLPATLTVAQTASNYAIQELTHGTRKYKRTLARANGSIFENWQVLSETTITDYAKKGIVVDLTDLNTYVDEGIFACTSPIMKSGIEAGDLNYPKFFEKVGGGILIVSKSGNFLYQVFMATQQKKIAVRQSVAGGAYSSWTDMLDIVPNAKKTFLAYGSSSFSYMSAKIKTMIESFNATYVSDAISGQILETMQAHQGSNPVSITFNDGVTALNNVASAVTVTQKDDLGSLTANGSFIVTLSNGLKGRLDLNANTFTASSATEIYNVGNLSFDVDFGYSDYTQSAYHIFNIGKNNIAVGSYTSQQVLDETNRMIDFIKNKGNQNFIVGGHFVDRGMTVAKKQVVLDVNAALKAKYGMKYFDMQDYLMSAQIWTDLNITPTQDDLDKQAVGELAVSLSRDSKHMSADVDTLIVDRLKQKLLSLGYL